MSEYKDKLDRIKRAPVTVEFVDSGQVYKQLETIYQKFGESSEHNKEFLSDVSKMISGFLETMAKGVSINNLDQIEIKPTFNTPDVIVPEIKSPTVNVPAPTVIKEDDIFSRYKPADVRVEGTTKFYGYLAKDGSWFILRETGDDNGSKYRYTTGKKGFKKAFTNRQAHDYKYIDEVDFE